jgi:hypothetical protein
MQASGFNNPGLYFNFKGDLVMLKNKGFIFYLVLDVVVSILLINVKGQSFNGIFSITVIYATMMLAYTFGLMQR